MSPHPLPVSVHRNSLLLWLAAERTGQLDRVAAGQADGPTRLDQPSEQCTRVAARQSSAALVHTAQHLLNYETAWILDV